jgi:hypothetical protein
MERRLMFCERLPDELDFELDGAFAAAAVASATGMLSFTGRLRGLEGWASSPAAFLGLVLPAPTEDVSLGGDVFRR